MAFSDTTDLDFHPSRYYYGSEGEGVWTDGGDEDGRGIGVDH